MAPKAAGGKMKAQTVGPAAADAGMVDQGGIIQAGVVAPSNANFSTDIELDSLVPSRSRKPLECPPGLEGLCFMDRLHVVQHVQAREEMGKSEQANKYDICTANGQKVLTALEESDMCSRKCCGDRRSWTFHFHDRSGRDLMNIKRGLRFDCCCCPCCLHQCKVHTPNGEPVAQIKQRWHFLSRPKFTIVGPDGEPELLVSGPFCTVACLGSNVLFEILSADGKHLVGTIEKRWAGVLQEKYTKADHYALQFPKDLHVRCKCALISAAILIDFMYYEKK